MSREHGLTVLVVFLYLMPGFRVPAAEPANPKTNAKARAILDYLESLPRRPPNEKRLISGQFAGFGSGTTLRACEEAVKTTGHWPAMIGLDYAEFPPADSISRSSTGWPSSTPAREGWSRSALTSTTRPTRAEAACATRAWTSRRCSRPGHETHRRWMQELDILAAGLAEIQDAGVVVLWRPFHEMNGDWFWWGGKNPEAFISVWRHMFDYFTNTKGLNNLLWVYGPNHGKKTAAYYAGDAFVDIVGLDAYTDFVDPNTSSAIRRWPACPSRSGSRNSAPTARTIRRAITTTCGSATASRPIFPRPASSCHGTTNGAWAETSIPRSCWITPGSSIAKTFPVSSRRAIKNFDRYERQGLKFYEALSDPIQRDRSRPPPCGRLFPLHQLRSLRILFVMMEDLMDHFVTLDRLPEGIEFPTDLKDKIWFDAESQKALLPGIHEQDRIRSLVPDHRGLVIPSQARRTFPDSVDEVDQDRHGVRGIFSLFRNEPCPS